MTYQEIKDRLSKCELTLEKLKNGNKQKSQSITAKIDKLTLLKETYTKLLKEGDKTAFINGQPVEYEKEDELKKYKDNSDVKTIKTAKGKDIKEQDGAKFSIEETKSIAKSVGKAVAMSLKTLGDEVATMKARNIEENSFEIYVQYKNDAEDEFSFYIVDDTLHLTDFSFDKELTDVGVKPSGEAVVNVDVLANELVKHFKSMNEDEEEDARNDADYERGWHDDPRADEALKEAPEGMSYIEVSVRDARKAMAIMDDMYRGKFEMNGSTVYYFKDDSTAYDAMMDLGAKGIEIEDTNIEESVKEGEVDKEADRGDLDVGHQDDEPNMLKSSAFETAEYAAKLVKKLDMYDKHDGEVDFPNWWQKKLILARDYMSAAFHYLDSQEKQPAIDQLALENKVNEGRGDLQTIVGIIKDRASDSGFSEAEEAQEVIEAIQDHYKLNGVEENVDKVAGGIPYRQEGNKFVITEPLDDATKERLIGKAKEHGYHAAPNQAGGVTITRKGGMNERLNGDQQSALMDLQNILDQAAQLGDEARSIIQDTFPEELRGAEAYDVFNFGSSSNSYDNTLESLISDIERRFSEDEGDDDDMDEGVAKTKKAHDLVVTKMKELAKQYKAGDTSVVDQLKDLTAKKKSLEAMLDKDVAGTGRDQALEEAGPGFKHDCAAKVVHETYGKGNTIPEKHTLVKEGTKYVVTHYDVLFENGNTVTDIPVSELDIKTTNEHWHKGYKKKKK